MSKFISKYRPTVFVNTGGGPQFLPKDYKEAIKPFKKDLESKNLIFANIDTIPGQLEYLRDGISTINVGQRPYEMGQKSAIILKDLLGGKEVQRSSTPVS